MQETVQHTIQGEEKARYLYQLDNSLFTLAKNLAAESDKNHSDSLVEFGRQHDWDWDRLPKRSNTFQNLAQLVYRVREEYQWFDWLIYEDSARNRGYFDEIGIDAQAGLPWAFDFIALSTLKKNADETLSSMPSHKDLVARLKGLLMQDYAGIEDVPSQTSEVSRQAMKRSFLEQLKQHNPLVTETGNALPVQATKMMSLGAEELWNLAFINYSKASSMFQVYVIDLWQDMIQPQIIEKDGRTVVSDRLAAVLNFSPANAAWYILKTVDDKFPSLHPVHVSRGLIGPFENRYCTKRGDIEPLQVTGELLKEDPSAGLLRFSRQYSYAPSHIAKGVDIKQRIHTENWSDEMIVVPSRHASRVAKSVLGTNVRVYQS